MSTFIMLFADGVRGPRERDDVPRVAVDDAAFERRHVTAAGDREHVRLRPRVRAASRVRRAGRLGANRKQ
jgi:hypothetical protein